MSRFRRQSPASGGRPGSPISRRRLLAAAGAISSGAALAACTGGGQSAEEAKGGAGGDTGTVAWWDQFRPLTELFEEEVFGPYAESHPGVTINRRQMEGPDLGQALQLARRSNQLPDVHSLAGLEAAPAALVAEDWFQPIGDLVDVDGSPIADQLYDGIHRFDDQIYTIPVFTGRSHVLCPWTNTELLQAADVDPDTSPATWDDLRGTLKTLTKKTPDDAYGTLLPSQDPAYLTGLITHLAQTAGAPGGIDWRTGEYVYHSQPFLDAIEYLQSLQSDQVVHPSSPSMGPRDGRARFAAGHGAVYLWGSWIIGGLMVEEPEAIERGIGVWQVPSQEQDGAFVYGGPPGAPFWVSGSSKNAKLAADVLLQLVTEDVQRKLAETMDQAPVLTEIVADSDAHPTYKRNVEYMTSDTRIAPVPEVGTPDVAMVLAEMRDVHPDLGEIVQSVLTGDTADPAKALKQYSDKVTAERDRAIATVQKDGGKVDTDAWVFGNWDPTQDYTQESYDAR